MRYAILSDIHANLEALTAVLGRIDEEGVDKIICLGDLVGYYANPNECLEILRDRRIHCIAGNHDQAVIGAKDPSQFWEIAKRAILWTRGRLTDDNMQFLMKLPMVNIIDGECVIVHASLYPFSNNEHYLFAEEDISKCFEKLLKHPSQVNICFFGHTHHSAAYEYQDGIVRKMNEGEVKLRSDAYYLLNPGSVGQSRDHDPRARFLIFDGNQRTVRFYRVEYDITECHRKADQSGLLDQEGLLFRSINRFREWFTAGRTS